MPSSDYEEELSFGSVGRWKIENCSWQKSKFINVSWLTAVMPFLATDNAPEVHSCRSQSNHKKT